MAARLRLFCVPYMDRSVSSSQRGDCRGLGCAEDGALERETSLYSTSEVSLPGTDNWDFHFPLALVANDEIVLPHCHCTSSSPAPVILSPCAAIAYGYSQGPATLSSWRSPLEQRRFRFFDPVPARFSSFDPVPARFSSFDPVPARFRSLDPLRLSVLDPLL